MNRKEALDAAEALVNGPRKDDYGPAQGHFDSVGRMWAEIIGVPITGAQVILCVQALKMRRLAETQDHVDSWVDVAGYASLGAEVTTTNEVMVDVPVPSPVSAAKAVTSDTNSVVINLPPNTREDDSDVTVGEVGKKRSTATGRHA